MRDQLRKIIAKESVIFLAFAATAVVLIGQKPFVERTIERKQLMLARGASLEQNLAVIGLDQGEIEAVLMLEDFKKEFPQFSNAGYREAVGFYLSQYPDYAQRDILYEKIARADNKINQAKSKLSKQRLLEGTAEVLKKIGLVVIALYPVTIALKVVRASKNTKEK
ncbi:MAG TPA: hypothetical protein VI749_06605 [Candidatus Omnitrophota bacterium]|nr:hypothetical protein [Candidatus Omnitrophota bacterium]